MKGTLLLTRWKSSRVSSTWAVMAMARKWRTAFVEPPRAIVMTRAFSNEAFVRSFEGVMSRSRQVLIAEAARTHSRSLAGEAAGVEDEPGRDRPIDSIAVAIVLAVYIPPQAPWPGHAFCSRSSMISSFVALVGPPSLLGCFSVLYLYAPKAS